MKREQWEQTRSGRSSFEVQNHRGVQAWKSLLSSDPDENSVIGLALLVGIILLIVLAGAWLQ